MRRKHTPGPWYRNAIKGDRIVNLETDSYDKILVSNPNATVATVYRVEDARLIAAAPELLAALQGVWGFFCMSDWETGAAGSEFVDAARSAIAQATGGDA